MKTLALVMVLLFCGSAFSAEKPAYLRQPTPTEQTVHAATFVGFLALATTFVVLGVEGMAKMHPGASLSEQKTGANMITAALICDGVGAVTLTAINIAF